MLILDEPVTGLDPAAAQDLYRTLAYLNKTEGIAIVMVTHDMENALRYADFILHAGQVLQPGRQSVLFLLCQGKQEAHDYH